MGDVLAGRFDLKADRATGRLLVQASWYEEGGPQVPAAVAASAVVELRRMADWLGLPEVAIAASGNLHAQLTAAANLLR